MARSSPVGGSKSDAAKRPRRDFKALERRRMRAAEMFRRGKRQADVARALGVAPSTVCEWYRVWSKGGKTALAGAGRAGRLPRLSDEQLRVVVGQLGKGPRANGYATDLWTLARISEVIATTTGVRYSQTQTWEIMRKRLAWSRQRPARRAVERDDKAIANWMTNEWPRIKKAPAGGGPGSSSKTKAASRYSRR